MEETTVAEPDMPQTTPEEEMELKRARMIELRTLDRNFQKDKAIFCLQMHMWSGRRVQSDEELIALGIADIEAYKKTRTKGSKELVPQAALRDINRVKAELERDLRVLSARSAGVKNLYFIRMDLLDQAVERIMEAESQLEDRVSAYIDNENGFEKDREDMIEKHMKESNGNIMRKDLEKEYPSASQIRGKYRVGFLIARLPVGSKISDLVDEYQLQKIEEEAKATVEETQRMLRGVIVRALASFKEGLGNKNLDQKVNNRTISMIRNTFDQFENIGTMFGDSEVSKVIQACKHKFDMAESWTVEEVKALGIEDAVQGVLDKATDTADQIERQNNYINSLYVEDSEDDGVGELDRSTAGLPSRSMSFEDSE